MRYKTIYGFQVFEKVSGGEKPFALDKQTKRFYDIGEETVNTLATLLALDEIEPGRLEFFIEVTGEKENVEEF